MVDKSAGTMMAARVPKAGGDCAATDAGTAPGDPSSALQEIVVTARRQSEDLEKVPVAVVALSTSALSEQHVTTEQELQTAVPGLLTVPSTSANQLAFSIRGQALDAYSFTSPTVLAYFDEFQTGGVTSTTFFDLESVQVLKGIEGTLFGRNATGGAVLYTTTQPGKALEGYFNYTTGNFSPSLRATRRSAAPEQITLPLRLPSSVRARIGAGHAGGKPGSCSADTTAIGGRD